LRCDKLIIAALSEVLNEYNNKDFEQLEIPVISMLTISKEELIVKANDLKCIIDRDLSNYLEMSIIDDEEEVGGGSLPGHKLNGVAVAIVFKNYNTSKTNLQININQLQENLRKLKIPIICRIKDGSLMLNLRTIDISDFKVVALGIKEALGIE
jgi:L-seryl-tRNA(Ser) seleniumtransferase